MGLLSFIKKEGQFLPKLIYKFNLNVMQYQPKFQIDFLRKMIVILKCMSSNIRKWWIMRSQTSFPLPHPNKNNNLTTTHNWKSLWGSFRVQFRTAATQWITKTKDGYIEKHRKHCISITPFPILKATRGIPLAMTYHLKKMGEHIDLSRSYHHQGHLKLLPVRTCVIFADAHSPCHCIPWTKIMASSNTMHTCGKDAHSYHFYST